ncbi:MAG: thioredoxin family protein [Verrucomicrobia bacterium]|nr:thioredoxin family protein [Verrucomicrobiota bacterium]
MKTILLSLLTICPVLALSAAENDWFTDMPKALAQAKQEKKMVLVDFTGSDWCGWCIKFKKEVLSTPEFAEYAKKNLVLVELDFPKRKTQDEKQKAANKKLKDKYEVRGFPTLLLLKSSGKEAWRQVGYLEGGPKAFIAALEKAKK